MAGTKNGGEKTKATIYERYGKDHYSRIGAKGGSARVEKGFAKRRELASENGRKGGIAGRRGKIFIAEDKIDDIYRLRNGGNTIKSIVEQTGISYVTVQRLCRLWEDQDNGKV